MPQHLPLTPAWLYWAYPWVLACIAALPLLWVVWRRRERMRVIRFSSLQTLRQVSSRWAQRLALLPAGLRMAALAALIVAAARPQVADESSRLYAEGIAIQMVVDTSGSMSDYDLSPPGAQMTRLDVVKDVFRRFVKGDRTLPGRPNDLIGMIRFARYADSVCPLTLDHDALLDVLDQTRIVRSREEDGTAIGDALALAVARLKDLKRTTGAGEQLTITSRVIILLTDGENNYGAIAPEQAGELAATYGIKVYAIMAGTGRLLEGSLFGEATRLPVDDRDLRRIAEVTGGRFFHARDADALLTTYAEIDRLERTRTEEKRYVRWGDLSGPWLLAAFGCVAAQTLLSATRLRRIP